MTSFDIADNAATYDALGKAYAQDHRHYHNTAHVAACLTELDAVVELADRPHEIEIALWFYDAVYDPFSSTNERDSADWAMRFLADNDVADDVAGRIESLIMVTAGHSMTSSPDEDLMIDIDLSILGSDPPSYDHFEQSIRCEYENVPQAIFRQKRSEILGVFLSQKPLYRTPVFEERLGDQARENLQRAIVRLERS